MVSFKNIMIGLLTVASALAYSALALVRQYHELTAQRAVLRAQQRELKQWRENHALEVGMLACAVMLFVLGGLYQIGEYYDAATAIREAEKKVSSLSGAGIKPDIIMYSSQS